MIRDSNQPAADSHSAPHQMRSLAGLDWVGAPSAAATSPV